MELALAPPGGGPAALLAFPDEQQRNEWMVGLGHVPGLFRCAPRPDLLLCFDVAPCGCVTTLCLGWCHWAALHLPCAARQDSVACRALDVGTTPPTSLCPVPARLLLPGSLLQWHTPGTACLAGVQRLLLCCPACTPPPDPTTLQACARLLRGGRFLGARRHVRGPRVRGALHRPPPGAQDARKRGQPRGQPSDAQRAARAADLRQASVSFTGGALWRGSGRAQQPCAHGRLLTSGGGRGPATVEGLVRLLALGWGAGAGRSGGAHGCRWRWGTSLGPEGGAARVRKLAPHLPLPRPADTPPSRGCTTIFLTRTVPSSW